MLSPELLNLLQLWDVEDEYIANFEKEKILKVSTLLLLKEKSIERLFPEEGPQLEFSCHLAEYKKKMEKSPESPDPPVEQQSLQLNALAPVPVAVFASAASESSEIIIDAPGLSNFFDDLEPSKPTGSNNDPINPQSSAPKASERKRAHEDNYDLEEICRITVNGKLVLSHYSTYKSLNEKHRNLLADLMISDYLKDDVNKMLPANVEMTMTEHIVKLFPNEPKEVWMCTSSQKRHKALGRGKLLNRFYNMRRELMKSNIIQRSATPRANSSSLTFTSDEDENQADRDHINDSLLWLQNNKQPWAEVMTAWKLTSKTRVRGLLRGVQPVHEYMNTYPAFKDPSGYLLLELDFESMYPERSIKFYTEWPTVSGFILMKIPQHDREEIDLSISPEAKKIRTFLALNKIFSVVTAAKKGKKQWRPSRIESQEGLLQFVESNADIQTVLASRRSKYEQYGIKFGPQAVCIGPDADEVSSSYVVINQVIFEVESPFKAIDITFKAMHALDTPYHVECKREWQFLQLAVYGIDSASEQVDGKMRGLVAEYTRFKSSA